MTTTDARKRRREQDRPDEILVPRAILNELAEGLREAAKSHKHAATSFKGLAAYVDSLADE